MALAMTIRKLLLALLLSLIATFVISTVYVFFPLIVLLLKTMWGARHIDSIFSVGSGVQLRAFLIIEPIIFVITFLLLYRKQTA
ncbi:MAG TPA: hypothetical protein DC054_15880 [Blastocatellia bacterium]|nr:hypothetical protein [Blastocatellia bacterium]